MAYRCDTMSGLKLLHTKTTKSDLNHLKALFFTFFLTKFAFLTIKVLSMLRELAIALLLVLFSASFSFSAETATDETTDTPLTIAIPAPEPHLQAPSIVTDYGGNELADTAVKRHVSLFSEKIRERFSLWLRRSGKYLEMMKQILKEKNIPEDIVFLSLIESGFSANAYSPARAAGYWQFIASTAKRYGLEIDWWRDERRDPVKSTEAAADYLKDLYEMFGSWNLAMAAYNAGEGRILKALNKANAEDYWSLLNTNHIRKETKEYVPKFIAASMIANSPSSFGFEDLEYHRPLDFDTVVVHSPSDIEVLAACAETTEVVIRELNPELRRWCTPPDVSEYALRIPAGSKDVFYANLSEVSSEERFTVDTYKVRKGDTFKKISTRTGIPVQVILDLNDMEKMIPLAAGKTIYLPPKDKYVPDREDRLLAKKASLNTKKKISGKKKAGSKKTIAAKKKPAKKKSVQKVSNKTKKKAKSARSSTKKV
jgi:membrane-bound lytic murein transglycosylase D